jgi:hypothetical protein
MFLRPGKPVIIRGNKSFIITTGNAAHLQLKVNGKGVSIPGADKHKVIKNWPIPLDGGGGATAQNAATVPAVQPSITPPQPARAHKTTGAKPKNAAESDDDTEETQAKNAPHYTYNVTLEAKSKDVWIYVIIDDNEVRDMYIRAGRSVALHGNKSFKFTTGNALHLSVKVNGKPVYIPGSTDNKVIRNWLLPLEQ